MVLTYAKKFLRFTFLCFLIFALFSSTNHSAQANPSDQELYEKYELYQKYEKYKKYQKYKDYKEAKEKYGFTDSTEKNSAKEGYLKYKEYQKNPKAFSQYAKFYELYKDYKKYKNKYQPLKEYSIYSKYKKYNDSDYKNYQNYGSEDYQNGYTRYKNFLQDLSSVTKNRGNSIRVGLWSYSKDDLMNTPFKIEAEKKFRITNCASTIVGEINPGENARVTYLENSGGHLQVYNNIGTILPTDIGEKACFEASDLDNENMIFDVNRPDSSYDQYRGKIKMEHSNTTDNENEEGSARRIWVINESPLELYVWGLGEVGGGVTEHTKTMVVAFRTYGRWYMEYATKWADEGFQILSTSGSQIYKGYDYETAHSSIRELAQQINGIIMKSGDNIALAAYGSWTDGTTRRYEDGHWGGTCRSISGISSSAYPELSKVDDPYGKHSSLSTCELASAGNHMVGLSANGSLVLARDHNWNWNKILNHYYTGIKLVKEY